jgi:hypothetical protein
VKDDGRHSGGGSWRGGLAPALGLAVLLFCGGTFAQDAARPLTVVVFGDSQAQGLGWGLSRDLIADPHVRILNRSRPGAALVHDPSQWLAPIRRFLAQDKADIAIVMFGANDRIDMPAGEGGRYLRFRTPQWRAEYVERVDRVMKMLTDAGLKVIWCGNPIARSQTYSADMGYINQIFAEEAARFGIKFLPLWTAVADADGRYMAYGKDREGVTRRLRNDDGIHFTPAGYELVAEKVAALLPASAINAAAQAAP